MGTPTEPRVVSAEAWLCPLQLAHPLHLGAISYTTRDYVVLKLTTEDGFTGFGIGYTRGTPLLGATEVVASQLGDLPLDPEAAQHALERRFAPGWAALVRGASLLDLALWDLKAQREGVPVATALGFEPRAVPLMAVAGYFSDLRSSDQQLAEMDRFVQEGYSTLKLILPGHDARADRQFLEKVRSHIPDRVAIAVDFHGAFETVREGLDHCAALHDLGVQFIEDPYPSADWHQVRDFAQGSPTPVAGGEDLPGLTGLVDLVDHGVGFLRADATASGGYTTTRRAVSHAVTAGKSVRPHVWPHVHIHLAAGCPGDTPVEVIPEHVGADPVWSLLTEGAPISAGRWRAPSVAGLGIPFDEESVAAHAVDSFRLELRAPVTAGV